MSTKVRYYTDLYLFIYFNKPDDLKELRLGLYTINLKKKIGFRNNERVNNLL